MRLEHFGSRNPKDEMAPHNREGLEGTRGTRQAVDGSKDFDH